MPRRFLYIFLAILQFIAPLVHAHAHNNVVNFGLHVPGLEGYQTEHLNKAALTAVSNYSYDDGFVIGVDTGFRQNQADNLHDVDAEFPLPLQANIVKPTLSAFDANFSPHYLPGFSGIHLSLQAPRAPPIAS